MFLGTGQYWGGCCAKEATLEFKSAKKLSMFFKLPRSGAWGYISKRTGYKSLAAQISSSHFALQTAP